MLEIDRQKIKALAEKYSLELVVLFGSKATGQTHENSDIDIAYLPTPDFSVDNEGKLYLDLMETVKNNQLDLVNLKQVSPLLLKQITDQCVVLYERRVSTFNRFVLYVSRLYNESAPLRQLEKDFVLNKTKLYTMQLSA